MNNLLTSHHPIRHAKSFKHAFDGIFHALLNEANFRIQMFIVAVAVFLGFRYNISNTEWGLLTLSMGQLLVAELVNTVVEEVIDHFIKDYHDAAKVIKDLSAGFVLLTAGTAFIILVLIFGHKVI